MTITEIGTDRPVPVRFVLIGEPADLPDSLRPEPPDSVADLSGEEGEEPRDGVVEGEAVPPPEGEAARPPEQGALEDMIRRARDAADQERPRAREGEEEPAEEPEGPPLPAQSVIVLLEEALRPATYRILAEGFVNLRGLSGGGDTTFVYVTEEEAPEQPDDEPVEEPEDEPAADEPEEGGRHR